MTDDILILRGLLEVTPDGDPSREMTGFAAERLMELKVGGSTTAAYGEKTTLRQTQRTGHRDWDTGRLGDAVAKNCYRTSPQLFRPAVPRIGTNSGQAR